MERLLSRPRVMIAFCVVLLLAALNRRDPMVYGMFLFLTTITVLGFVLPWLSLRGMAVRLQATGGTEVVEGMGCDLHIVVERSVRWPAFMVDVETEWEWAGQRVLLRQTVPVIRAGRAPALGRLVRFPCRGRYQLVAVRLASGFPLGLVQARHSMQQRSDIALHVLPAPQPVHWPLPWSVAPDPVGQLATRQMGQSFELGMLREYQHGESVGRVSWRASARVGELVIQHFQQMGSIRLRVVVHAPALPALGNPASAGEQAIRLAAGVCEVAQGHGVQAFLYLAGDCDPLQDASLVRHALAEALPGSAALLRQACARVAADANAGEQVALVVPCDMAQADLKAALAELAGLACTVVVCIALARASTPAHQGAAQGLQAIATQAGAATLMEAPWP